MGLTILSLLVDRSTVKVVPRFLASVTEFDRRRPRWGVRPESDTESICYKSRHLMGKNWTLFAHAASRYYVRTAIRSIYGLLSDDEFLSLSTASSEDIVEEPRVFLMI